MIRAENEGKQTEQGALILPRMGADGGYLFQCCDCALVHRLDFAITPAHGLEMRVTCDADATATARAAKAAEIEGWLDHDH
jgi:hypothetical protein